MMLISKEIGSEQEHDVDLLGGEVQFRLEGGLLPILYSSGHIGCKVYVLY